MDGLTETSGAHHRTQGRDAVRALAEREQFDAAALAIAERVRSRLALEQVLQLTADELGFVTGSSRCLIELAPNLQGVCVMIEWDRGDTRPVGVQPPTPVAQRVFETRTEVVLDDAAAIDDDVASYLRSFDVRSVIGYPIRWQHERVVGVISFQDSKPRDWRSSVLPLLQRLEGQLAAAFVQAEIHDKQVDALNELAALARMRDELMANVSHELRTPLTAMSGVVKTLRRDDLHLDDAKRAELLAVLDQETDRIIDLAADLLDFSKYRDGKQRLHPQRVRMGDLVRRAVREVEVEGHRRIHVDADDCVAEVDANRMIQVLTNLLTNAVRHGRGDVLVSCRVEESSLALEVSDEGCGLAQGREDELFEPFAHDSDRGDSTGLGLPIARAIVEAHGGSLAYLPPTRETPHRFVVTLPRGRDANR